MTRSPVAARLPLQQMLFAEIRAGRSARPSCAGERLCPEANRATVCSGCCTQDCPDQADRGTTCSAALRKAAAPDRERRAAEAKARLHAYAWSSMPNLLFPRGQQGPVLQKSLAKAIQSG